MKKVDCNFEGSHILLPLPPMDVKAEFEMDVYVRFMRYLRQVPVSRHDIGVLTAIQYVADMMDMPDEHITKILVDLGLRAPRMAFPEVYLEVVDKISLREIHDLNYGSFALRELRHHWQAIREDKFAAFNRGYPSLVEGIFTYG
ncbi:MAG TPA: hypothetical protein DCM27_02410 [Rhodospirillaceae bacterium]|nr:hypothetical protein [Rhodospirillaceae bacterium]